MKIFCWLGLHRWEQGLAMFRRHCTRCEKRQVHDWGFSDRLHHFAPRWRDVEEVERTEARRKRAEKVRRER